MKQLRSSSQDLRKLFEHGINVRHVVEELQCCRADENVTVVGARMKKDDFDVLGIQEGGVVYGYVERAKLKSGLCGQYQQTFHPSELIAESTPLIDLLPILRDKPRVFVLDRNRVNGIVTRGDLPKAPVRLLLFGLVTLLEMQLLRLVRIYYHQDSWQEHIKAERLAAAKKLHAERQSRNEAIDLADCLQFCDKRELVLKKPELLERMQFKSKMSGEHLLKEAEKLRDKLAHAQDIVTGSSWPEVIDLATEIEALLGRCEQFDGQPSFTS